MDANPSKSRSFLLNHTPVLDQKSLYLPNIPHFLGVGPGLSLCYFIKGKQFLEIMEITFKP